MPGDRAKNQIYYICISHRRLWTWEMPGDRAKNQIDYICISHRYRNGLLSTKTYHGADCGTDHVPVVATLRIKLQKLKKSQGKEYFDRGLLSSKNEFTEKYQKFVEQNSEKILTIEEPLSLFKTFSGTITKALKEHIRMKQNKKKNMDNWRYKRIVWQTQTSEKNERIPLDRQAGQKEAQWVIHEVFGSKMQINRRLLVGLSALAGWRL